MNVPDMELAEWTGAEMACLFRVMRCSRCKALAPVGDYCYACGHKMRTEIRREE